MAQEPEFLEEALPDEPSVAERLREYAAVLWKHRRLILVCLGTALIAAALYSVLSEPSYLASTVLSVDRDAATPLDANWRPQLYATVDPDFLPTQAKLLASREIAERVVRRLNLLEHLDLNPKKSGLFRKKDQGSEKKTVPAAQGEVLAMAGWVRGSVEVEQVKGTNLLELSCDAPTPKLAASIANAVAEAYIQWTLEAKSEMMGRASEFFAAQIQDIKKDLGEVEQQLLAYGRQKDIISVDPQTNVTLQKLESLNRDYASAVADRVAKEARYHEVDTSKPETIADTLSGGLIFNLRSDQLKLERDYAERLNLFKPEWPAMQQLKAQIDKGREHIDQVVRETVAKARDLARSDYLTALRREESLKAVLGTQKTEAMTLNSNAVEYNHLRTEVEAKRSMLDNLLKRQSEMEAMARLTGAGTANVRVVDRALAPGSPYRPSYVRNLLLGVILGGAAGVGLAFLLSFLDRSLRTPEQVEQVLGLPSLGVIPAVGATVKGYGSRKLLGKGTGNSPEEVVPDAIELLPHSYPRSRISERYRDLRTALLLSRAGGLKSIVITSCLPREGKTATAVNLAVVLGQLGKQVLLVDADLHRPRLHEILRVPNRTGLVSILAGNVDPARAIVKTDIPEVSVIPSGPASPNPSGLLSSEAMSRFLSLAQMNFDYVVLDAPPVIPVADALVLGNQTDGVVLCVKGGETPREQVARVRDKLHRSNVRILGVVINDLVEEKGGYADRYGYEDGYPGQLAPYGAERAASKASSV
ncbi:MAG: GumC family protein [Thermoanaerobaculia bacterium]